VTAVALMHFSRTRPDANMQPTEFIKTTSQLSAKSATGVKLGPLDVVRSTFADRGVTGFYRGCGPVVAGNALKAGTRFLTYETIRDLLRTPGSDTLSPVSNLFAGIAAGCIESVVAVTPSEAIKCVAKPRFRALTRRTRLIESQRAGLATSGGSMAMIGSAIRTEGFLSLYRGLVPTVRYNLATSAQGGIRLTCR
jgi:solute carrier family 25 citrate transporter 1